MKVNRVKDFVERVVWTALISAAAAAGATDFSNWTLTGKVAGFAALASALKVIAAQRVGTSGDGAAIPGGVIEEAK